MQEMQDVYGTRYDVSTEEKIEELLRSGLAMTIQNDPMLHLDGSTTYIPRTGFVEEHSAGVNWRDQESEERTFENAARKIHRSLNHPRWGHAVEAFVWSPSEYD